MLGGRQGQGELTLSPIYNYFTKESPKKSPKRYALKSWRVISVIRKARARRGLGSVYDQLALDKVVAVAVGSGGVRRQVIDEK